MKKNFKSLGAYLNWYYTNCQKDITLVYRGDQNDSWAKRCKYLDEKYQSMVNYNHRIILNNEVIIEYDTNDHELNQELASRVIKKLKKDGIYWAKWNSGNKSFHVHILVSTYNVKNISLLKKSIMRYYGTFYYRDGINKYCDTVDEVPDGPGEVKRIVPDLQLADAHLIRAEYGIHEKTQRKKSLVMKCVEYPEISPLPQVAWDKYKEAQEFSMKVRMGQQTKDISGTELVKQLLDTVQFKENMDDGRERLIFMLTHILKHKYKSWEDLADFLWSWYLYSGGRQLAEDVVRNKVKYHYYRNYQNANWERKLKELLDELIGREQLTLKESL